MQFTLGITGDLLTNEGNPCFGLQPLNSLQRKKYLLNGWILVFKFYQKKKLQNMMQYY